MSIGAFSQLEKVIITGKVTDFNNNSIDSAKVEIKNYNCQTIDSTYSTRNGNYSLTVDKGLYVSLVCIKTQDYRTNNLEFWAWNIPAFENTTLNIHYDKLEIYGVNVFKIQYAYPGYTIYFRPMSLTRFKNKMSDISPSIENLDLTVEINGKNVKINSIEKVSEFCNNKMQLNGFLIQTDLPDSINNKDYDIIRILGKDKETGDIGEAIYYKTKEQYK
jgi:hypothetical protein